MSEDEVDCRGVARALTLEGASSFKECRATSPPGKFKILYRVSEFLKNRGSPILEVWARRIYETINLIENRMTFLVFLYLLYSRLEMRIIA